MFVGLLVGLVRTGLTYPLTYYFLWASAVFNFCFSSEFFSSLVNCYNRLPVFRSSQLHTEETNGLGRVKGMETGGVLAGWMGDPGERGEISLGVGSASARSVGGFCC